MEKFAPQIEKNPAARVMSLQEMNESLKILALMQNAGKGDVTVNQLVRELDHEINLKLGKRSGEEVGQEFFDQVE